MKTETVLTYVFPEQEQSNLIVYADKQAHIEFNGHWDVYNTRIGQEAYKPDEDEAVTLAEACPVNRR